MTDLLDPLYAAGTACVLELSGLSGPDQEIVHAVGASQALLGLGPELLGGRRLVQVLESATAAAPGRSGAGPAVSLATGKRLLAYWGGDEETGTLLLLDAEPLGAPRTGSFSEELAGAAAHDLRNPLASVKLNLQILARDFGDAGSRAGRRLEIALREVAVLERELEELSEFGRASIAPARIGLQGVLGLLAQEMEAVLATQVQLEADAEPLWIMADEAMLARAAAGLVRLAARGGGGLVQVALRRTRRGDARVSIRRAALDPPQRRTLALALARRVAEDSGGTFRVERTPEGAELVWELPLAPGLSSSAPSAGS